MSILSQILLSNVVLLICVYSLSQACTCADYKVLREEKYDKSDFVSHVKILNQTIDDEIGQVIYDVQHLKVYKPTNKDKLPLPDLIYTSTSLCGIWFNQLKNGEEYLLNGYFLGETLHVNVCSIKLYLIQNRKRKMTEARNECSYKCLDLCDKDYSRKCEKQCNTLDVNDELKLEDDPLLKTLLNGQTGKRPNFWDQVFGKTINCL